jgi:hypothetical protein
MLYSEIESARSDLYIYLLMVFPMRFAVSPGTFHLALRVCPTTCAPVQEVAASCVPDRYNRYNARADFAKRCTSPLHDLPCYCQMPNIARYEADFFASYGRRGLRRARRLIAKKRGRYGAPN